jgi:hypothetical protein
MQDHDHLTRTQQQPQASTQAPCWRARPGTSSRRRLTAATRSDHHRSLRPGVGSACRESARWQPQRELQDRPNRPFSRLLAVSRSERTPAKPAETSRSTDRHEIRYSQGGGRRAAAPTPWVQRCEASPRHSRADPSVLVLGLASTLRSGRAQHRSLSLGAKAVDLRYRVGHRAKLLPSGDTPYDHGQLTGPLPGITRPGSGLCSGGADSDQRSRACGLRAASGERQEAGTAARKLRKLSG